MPRDYFVGSISGREYTRSAKARISRRSTRGGAAAWRDAGFLGRNMDALSRQSKRSRGLRMPWKFLRFGCCWMLSTAVRRSQYRVREGTDERRVFPMNNTGFQQMGASIRRVETDSVSVSDEQILTRLAGNPRDTRCLELLIDRQRWIVEDELSLCFGTPPWFDSAVAVVLTAIVRETPRYNPRKRKAAQWIRAQSRRLAWALANAIPNCLKEDGCLGLASKGSLESLVTLLLEQQRSHYWDDLRAPSPARRRGRAFREFGGGSHVTG